MHYLKIIFHKYLLLTSLFSCLLFSVTAQIRLDVEGDAKIRGAIDLIKAEGDSSVYIGLHAGLNDDGSQNKNTFIGLKAGELNSFGNDNTFIGARTGAKNTFGSDNTFIGKQAGSTNLNGSDNTFIGHESGQNNISGFFNTFIGEGAGQGNIEGFSNVIIGYNAGSSGSENDKNTIIGSQAGVSPGINSLDRAIAIGYNAKVDCHNCAVIGGTGPDSVKVGIGTPAPNYTLDVHFSDGDPATTPGSGLKLQNLGSNNHNWQLYVNNSTGDLELYNNEIFKGAFDDATGAYSSGTPSNKFVGNVEIINTLTDSSIYIGANSGINLPIAQRKNLFIGNNAGQANTNSLLSTIIGYDAGKNGTGGLNCTFVGTEAGFNNSGTANTFVGFAAGRDNETGTTNAFFGASAGLGNKASFNTFLGASAGITNFTGDNNTFVGTRAGNNNISGSENIFIGSHSGLNGIISTKNTIIGTNAGPSGIDSLDRAMAIGYNAMVDCHNCAVIGGTGLDAVKVGIGTSTPIYTFDVQHANGTPSSTSGNGLNIKNIGSNNNEWQLYVGDVNGKLRLYKNGVLRGTFDEVSGNYTPSSDRRLKNNVQSLENQLALINRLRPTSYHFNGRKTERKVYGLIAQEVQKIIPDIVLENEADNPAMKTLGISYTELIPVLIAGMQEQQKMIQDRDKTVEDLATKLVQLENRLTEIEEKDSNQLPVASPFFQELPIEQITLNTPMLWQNTPNPFNENTQIQYSIPKGYQQAIIRITNQQGQVIHTQNISSEGQGAVNIQIGNAANGNYFYSLILDGQVYETKQMVIVK